ncbi:MAG TPA: hypothetical protein VGI64_13055 [Streptosporangiaceae bacterium]
MNPGGEPDRDDFGLPPVDIEIPDDARELDRDVQAYHREQRALRRQRRLRRLYRPATGDGVIMPLLAGCLIFALIAAVVLTVFTASGDVIPRGQASGPASGGPAASAPATQAPAQVLARLQRLPGHLPDKTVSVNGQAVRLSHLGKTALAIVPGSCACQLALQALIRQAGNAGVPVYLVGSATTAQQLRQFAAGPAGPRVAVDRAGLLASRYQTSATGPSLILVGSDQSLRFALTLPPESELRADLVALP